MFDVRPKVTGGSSVRGLMPCRSLRLHPNIMHTKMHKAVSLRILSGVNGLD